MMKEPTINHRIVFESMLWTARNKLTEVKKINKDIWFCAGIDDDGCLCMYKGFDERADEYMKKVTELFELLRTMKEYREEYLNDEN